MCASTDVSGKLLLSRVFQCLRVARWGLWHLQTFGQSPLSRSLCCSLLFFTSYNTKKTIFYAFYDVAWLDNTFIIYAYLLLISVRMDLPATEKYQSSATPDPNTSAHHLRSFLCLAHFLLFFTKYRKGKKVQFGLACGFSSCDLQSHKPVCDSSSRDFLVGDLPRVSQAFDISVPSTVK